MVRIVHASDLHLDASYAFLTGKKLEERRDDFLNSLDSILKISTEEKADVLLIAGDFYDKVNPTNEARYHALRSLKEFTKKNMTKIFIVSGNHDAPKSSFMARTPIDSLGLLDGIMVESGGQNYKHYRIEDGKKSLGIYLKGYDGLHGHQNPVLALPQAKDDINIAVLHGSLDLAQSYYSEFKDYAPFTVEDCTKKGFDCFAMGHMHGAQHYITEHGIFVYPGCPQRYSFKEAEGDKGIYLIDTDSGLNEDSINFLPLPCRELVILEIELDKTMDDLEQVILDSVKNDDRNKLLNIQLTGTILFDAYKKLKISNINTELSEYWFAVKVEKGFQVYDPNSEYEFRDLSSIGPLEEFKKAINNKLEVAKEENNEGLIKKYEWMLEEGQRILMKIQGEEG